MKRAIPPHGRCIAFGGWAFGVLALFASFVAAASERPNILWLSSEDHGPDFGCYGDAYATTPVIDAFAATALRYTRATSNAPVCAPARTTIISGMYPPSTGSQHMRSRVPAPSFLRFFPAYLQDAGYYTTNNSKEDYNLVVEDKGWDESSTTAHYRNRPDGAPFFAVFNFTGTHESQIRNENDYPFHDPADAPVPPFHPDTATVRADWAQYYDRLLLLDGWIEEKLDELAAAGLAEDTIVFLWGDHGSGMPRYKRFPGWSGLHVPLIVHFPEKWRHLAPEDYAPGGASDRLVSFVDLAPTVLSLAGVEIPDYYHGHAFAGRFVAPAPDYAFGFRGRMDERPDFCRVVTDGRFLYRRNFYPFLPHGQFIAYQQETATTSQWYEMFLAGDLPPVQARFWEPRPAEELYDLAADPHETVNLVGDPSFRDPLAELRAALLHQMRETRDLGIIPEPMLREVILRGESPLEAFASLMREPAMAELMSIDPATAGPALSLAYPYRLYWSMIGLLSESPEALPASAEAALMDVAAGSLPLLEVVAAECLATFTASDTRRETALALLVEHARYPENELILTVHALNALERLQDRGHALPASVAELEGAHDSIPWWVGSHRPNLLERLRAGNGD